MLKDIGNYFECCFIRVREHVSLLLQPLRWRCIDIVIHHDRDVREEQHHYICSASKQ